MITFLRRLAISGYIFTLLLMVLITLFQYFFPAFTAKSTFLIYLPAVFAVSWFIGFWPAVFGIGVIVISVNLLLTGALLPSALFVAISLFACWVISRNRESEEALRRSEGQFKTLADNISQLAWIADKRGHRQWYNKRWYDYTGTNPEMMKGEGWRQLHHPERLQEFEQRLENGLRTGTGWESTVQLRGASGGYRWFLNRVVPIRDDSGKVVRWFGTDTDITEMKQIEDQLRESERRYRELFQTMEEAFFVVEIITDDTGTPKDWRYLEVNRAVIEYMRMSEDKMTGHTYSEVVPYVDPHWVALLGKVALEGEPATKEMYAPTRGRWLRVRAYSPRPGQAAVIFDDITEQRRTEQLLKQSEDQLRVATVAADIGVWSWISGTNDVSVSANWRQLFGVNPDAVVTFETWVEVIHSGDRDRVLKRLDEVARNREEFSHEYRVVRPDGSIRWIVDRGRAFYDPHGRATRVAGVNMDITEQKYAEEQREQAIRARDEVLAIVSHDLKNPLAAISLSAALLARMPEKETSFALMRQKAAVIKDAAARMSRLISDLLDISRMEAGHFSLEVRDCFVEAVLGDAVKEVLSQADTKGIHMEVDATCQGTAIYCDPDRTTQVLGNVLENAVKFSPEKTGVIRVRCEKTAEAVTFVIADNGLGISAEDLPHVFDRYWQAKRKKRGSAGLGLSIAKGITEAHSGTIRVQSVPGEGTTFYISFPTPEGLRKDFAKTLETKAS